MASAAFTIEGTPVSGGTAVTVAGGATVDLALVSAVGVRLIEWEIVGTSDHSVTTPTIATAGTPTGVTASFPMPSPGSSGYSVVVKCRVNGGVDAEGVKQSELTLTGLVGVANSKGRLPFSAGETFERQPTHGIAKDLNDQLAVAGSDATALRGINLDAATVGAPNDGDVVFFNLSTNQYEAGAPSALTLTLAQVLADGNLTGGRDVIFSTGDSAVFNGEVLIKRGATTVFATTGANTRELSGQTFTFTEPAFGVTFNRVQHPTGAGQTTFFNGQQGAATFAGGVIALIGGAPGAGGPAAGGAAQLLSHDLAQSVGVDASEALVSLAAGNQWRVSIDGTTRASLTASALEVRANFRFDSLTVAPRISQEVDSFDDATGDTLVAQAQDVTGGGTTITGGAFDIRAGNANTGTATNKIGGKLRMLGGLGDGTANHGDVEMLIGNVVRVLLDASADLVKLGDLSGGQVFETTSGGLIVKADFFQELEDFTGADPAAPTNAVRLWSNSGRAHFHASQILFDKSQTTALFGIQAATSGAGRNLTVQAGGTTDLNQDGGSLFLRGGGADGTGTPGGVQMTTTVGNPLIALTKATLGSAGPGVIVSFASGDSFQVGVGDFTLKLEVTGSDTVIHTANLGFYGATAVNQAADPGALTDSSGGTTDGTVQAVSGSGADAAINNNFAELTAKYNALHAVLSEAAGGVGLTA